MRRRDSGGVAVWLWPWFQSTRMKNRGWYKRRWDELRWNGFWCCATLLRSWRTRHAWPPVSKLLRTHLLLFLMLEVFLFPFLSDDTAPSQLSVFHSVCWQGSTLSIDVPRVPAPTPLSTATIRACWPIWIVLYPNVQVHLTIRRGDTTTPAFVSSSYGSFYSGNQYLTYSSGISR